MPKRATRVSPSARREGFAFPSLRYGFNDPTNDARIQFPRDSRAAVYWTTVRGGSKGRFAIELGRAIFLPRGPVAQTDRAAVS